VLGSSASEDKYNTRTATLEIVTWFSRDRVNSFYFCSEFIFHSHVTTDEEGDLCMTGVLNAVLLGCCVGSSRFWSAADDTTIVMRIEELILQGGTPPLMPSPALTPRESQTFSMPFASSLTSVTRHLSMFSTILFLPVTTLFFSDVCTESTRSHL
jgi:hypothetical protein